MYHGKFVKEKGGKRTHSSKNQSLQKGNSCTGYNRWLLHGKYGGAEDGIFLWYHTVWTFEPNQYYTYSKPEIESIGKSKPKTEIKWDQINPTVY